MDGSSPPHLEEPLDLGEEFRRRIEAELAPGERLLWAAPGRPEPSRSPLGYLFWGLVALVFLGLSAAGFAAHAGLLGPTSKADSPVTFALVTGGLGLLVILGIAAASTARRLQAERMAATLYALTDRRAIIWKPVGNAGAVEVQGFERGQVASVRRVEYPDGSGDLVFTNSQARSIVYPDESPARLVGEDVTFKSIAKVRHVEDLLRRTLVRADPAT